MRLGTIALGVLLPAAAVLSGCGVGKLASPDAASSLSKPIQGKTFGGQQPVTGATIALYTYGNTGYGSAGTLLASTTTGSDGYFTIDSASINCPTPDTPVYILSLGGNPGGGTNPTIALGAGLGTCGNAANVPFVNINEINTAMLAYTFSHFFSTVGSDGTSTDHFGAPASALNTITIGNSGTLNTMLDLANGYPRANTSTFQFEGAKLISLGNILAACVNSVGAASPSCKALFRNSPASDGTLPTDTLQAAVNIALHPTDRVSALYSIQPASGASAFNGGLSSAPRDWTLSASFTTNAFGLGIDDRTVSTLDIDSSGRVWFPSNASRRAGVAHFDPATGAFSALYSANLTHPQQVAIDIDDEVWVNDSASGNIAGFPGSTPDSPTSLSLSGTTSTALTIASDRSVRYGIIGTDGRLRLATVTGKSSYDLVPNSQIAGNAFFASSLGADTTGGLGIGAQKVGASTTHDFTYTAGGTSTLVLNHTKDSGQVVFTGGIYYQNYGGYALHGDGLCDFSAQLCYPMANAGQRHPAAMAVDGNATLWLADENVPSVEKIPYLNNSYLNANNYVNNTVFLDDGNNSNTLLSPGGIAVDNAGNVWVSNYGCYGTGCTPSEFTLSEFIGVGAPTLTPVSRQTVFGNSSGNPLARPTGASAK